MTRFKSRESSHEYYEYIAPVFSSLYKRYFETHKIHLNEYGLTNLNFAKITFTWGSLQSLGKFAIYHFVTREYILLVAPDPFLR